MAQKFWIVQGGENPSTDFFIKPALDSDNVFIFNYFDRPPSAPPDIGVSLVFVRYLSQTWVRWVEKHRDRIDELIYFMDDDLFDMATHRGLSMVYRWKLYYNAGRYRSWLKKQGASLWLSTPWLAKKYQDWQPRLLDAKSPYIGADATKTVFYHGSSSHMQEIHWLLPVIKTVLDTDSSLVFEIIGDRTIRRLFADIPRVNVVHPMSWASYKALVSRPGRTIGLAPLLAGSFNQARSFTKFYDITQAGAVGVYADHPVYQSIVRHEENGLLVPMQEQYWIDAILELSCKSETRQRLVNEARKSL